MRLVAVDPGLRGCGVAVFYAGLLTWASYVRSPEKTKRGGAAWIAMGGAVAEALGRKLGPINYPGSVGYVEYPQQYDGAGHTADRGDISELTAVAGGLALVLRGYCAEVRTPKPREWKGQTPKEIHVARTARKLSAAEMATLEPCPESLRHNVLDAVGIGLWALGRS